MRSLLPRHVLALGLAISLLAPTMAAAQYLVDTGPGGTTTIGANALFASGLLVTKVGGDSVFPYQPARVWDNSSPFINIYPDSVPDDEYHRRTM